MKFEEDKIEEILCGLECEADFFPGFKLEKENGKYNLLGEGGFSRVYGMNSVKGGDDRYVLKVVGFESQTVTSKNFWNAVELQQYLCGQSRYICRLISAKETQIEPDGSPLQFILMERLEDLISKDRFGRAFLRREELGGEEGVLEFALQIGQALKQAHDNGILHRDVKLENIFWDGRSQCYKLGDFGFAKASADGYAETVVFTNGYGAPEIALRIGGHYDVRADIYSFGITLYLLLNNLQFPGSDGYYVNRVQYNPEFIFPAPAHASRGMTRIIRKMCEFDQEDRYQSMAELLMDLNTFRRRTQEERQDSEVMPLDLETETYREEKYANVSERRSLHRLLYSDRERRRKEEGIQKELFSRVNRTHFILFTLLFTLFLGSIGADTSVIHSWKIWVFPAAVLLEAILLEIGEVYVLFWGIAFAADVWSGISVGLTASNIMLFLGLLTGLSAVIGASAASVLLWTVISDTSAVQWLEKLGEMDLTWVLLAVILCLWSRYILIHLAEAKITVLRVWTSVILYRWTPFVMTAAGLLLFLLEKFGGLELPEGIRELHLVRTGATVFLFCRAFLYWCNRMSADRDV